MVWWHFIILSCYYTTLRMDLFELIGMVLQWRLQCCLDFQQRCATLGFADADAAEAGMRINACMRVVIHRYFFDLSTQETLS